MLTLQFLAMCSFENGISVELRIQGLSSHLFIMHVLRTSILPVQGPAPLTGLIMTSATLTFTLTVTRDALCLACATNKSLISTTNAPEGKRAEGR